MFAIGFIMFMVFVLMASFNPSVKHVYRHVPTWYAVTGSLLFIGGILLMSTSLTTLIWRALP